MNPLTHHVYNLIILDESGSMQSIKKPTINGFNEIVETIRSVSAQFPEQEHFVSLVSFNSNGIKSIHWNEEASRLNKIDDNMYQPDGCTPLFDAIGQSVNRLKNELPGNRDYNVLVTILTDGQENDSRNYTAEQISKLISQLKEQAWTFAYIGANHDIVEAASKLSITNTLEFNANDADMAVMFDTERKARNHYYKKVSKNSKFKSFDLGYFADLKPEEPVDDQTPVDDKD